MAAFLPLTIKGGPCSSQCVNNNSTESKISSIEDLQPSTGDKAKITSNRANAGSEINNHTTQEEINKRFGSKIPERDKRRFRSKFL